MPGDGGCFRQHGQYRNRNSGKEFDSSAFHGKKLAAFGNSITAGDNSWAFQLRYLLDFGDFYNGAVGGAIWGKRKRDNGTNDRVTETDELSVEDMLAKETCTLEDAFGIRYFDCYHESGIDQSNVATHLRDGLHPNIKGQLLHSDYVAGQLVEMETR